MINCTDESNENIEQLIEFRLEANVNTYAAYANETESTRLDSHDFTYSNGSYTYHDTNARNCSLSIVIINVQIFLNSTEKRKSEMALR